MKCFPTILARGNSRPRGFPAGSVGRAAGRLGVQRADDAFNLAPAAEVDEIAEVPAAARAELRLRGRIVAETADEIGGLRNVGAAGKVNDVVQAIPRFF